MPLMGEPEAPSSSIVLYQTEDGSTRIECRFEADSIWLTQALIAELFQKDLRTVSEHLANIFDEGELSREATIRKFRIVRREGTREVSRTIEHYSLPAILAVGYRVRSKRGTQVFFQIIQNKLHFATTGKTAAELIAERADSSQPNMGLTAWKGDAVRKADVVVAKNYLHEEEIGELNRIVVMFLDFAEDQARRRKQIFLSTWRERLDDFLRFNDRRVLPDAGKVRRDQAEEVAEKEYELFASERRHRLEYKGEADPTMTLLAEHSSSLSTKRRRS